MFFARLCLCTFCTLQKITSLPEKKVAALIGHSPLCSALREVDELIVSAAAVSKPAQRGRAKGKGKGKSKTPAPAACEAKESSADTRLTTAIAACTSVLRDMPRGSTGQVILPLYPDFTAAATGAFMKPLCALLRNDSMTDMSRRCALYHSVFELLKLASCSGELCALMQAGSPSAVSLLDNMAKQAEIFVNGTLKILESAGRDEHEGEDEDTLAAQGMAMTIRDTVEAVRLHVAENIVTPLEDKEPQEQQQGDSRAMTDYIETLTKLRLQMVAVANNSHTYAENLRAHGSSSTTMMRRMKELSTMATNLPVTWESGIFLRVDEERNEALKALIIGPAGTPYENGCFVFDIYLPPTYPDVPPQVRLVDTSGGTIRMNPNLYANGKVCLSLLGTWSGPGWVPGKSTLLQVLLSIQALIMVAEPLHNEPGFENEPPARTAAYNEYIRLYTVKVGMLEQMQKKGSAFEDVVKTHFRMKKAIITAQVKDWMKRSKVPIKPCGNFGFPPENYGMGRGAGNPKTPDHVLQAVLKELVPL